MNKKLIIQPSKTFSPVHLRELWEYRELLYFLVWRDIKVRYKQAVLGIAWALIQPIVTMVIFNVIFNNLAKILKGSLLRIEKVLDDPPLNEVDPEELLAGPQPGGEVLRRRLRPGPRPLGTVFSVF